MKTKSFLARHRKLFGTISGIISIALLVIPLFVFKGVEAAKHTGYFGYFLSTIFGYNLLLLPFVVNVLNPVLLILIGAFGVTFDEIFAWYAGRNSDGLKSKKKFFRKIETFVEKYGLYAIFFLGLLPLIDVVYAVSGFAAGHYKINFLSYFMANFFGKLIRQTILVIILMNVL